MDIRKVSVGADYKSGAMHYIVGQEVLGKNYIIHLIQYDRLKIHFTSKEPIAQNQNNLKSLGH